MRTSGHIQSPGAIRNRAVMRVLCATGILLGLFLAGWPLSASAQTPRDVLAPRDMLAEIAAAEPDIAQVRRHVLRARGWQDPDLDRWSARARWSHLLPDLKGEVAWLDQRDLETSYREDLGTTDQGLIFHDSARNDFSEDSRLRTIYAVTVRWDLSGLVYDSSEPRIAREVSRRSQARLKALIEAGEVYYARRRSQVELAVTPAQNWRRRIELKLEVQRHTARLDAMTRGWFSKALAENRRKKTANQANAGANHE